MWNAVAVFVGTTLLAWVLFLRRPGAKKILSASRWMLLAWGFLVLVYLTSPIRYLTLHVTRSTWLYSALWLGAFVLADNVAFTFGGRPRPDQPAQAVNCSSRVLRMLAVMACLGSVMLAYTRSRGLMEVDLSSLLSELRESQVGGEDVGAFKTIATILACGGLLVALVDVCAAVRNRVRIPIRAGLGLLAYLSVTVLTAGRPGVVLGTLSLFIAALASVYVSGLEFAKFRSIFLVVTLVILASFGYIMLVVSTRTSDMTGGMDNKVTAMNVLWASDLDPEFRDSLRLFGALGDTVTESFYYISPQLYGLDQSLHHYPGPFGLGAIEFPYVARRLESLFGENILDPLGKADESTFEEAGVFPHFFKTAVQTTFWDFGPALSIPFVFFCGVLSRRARMRALHSKSPLAIGLQALICTGAAWTIIYFPSAEMSWFFPVMWFVVIQITAQTAYRFLSNSAAIHSASYPCKRQV